MGQWEWWGEVNTELLVVRKEWELVVTGSIVYMFQWVRCNLEMAEEAAYSITIMSGKEHSITREFG